MQPVPAEQATTTAAGNDFSEFAGLLSNACVPEVPYRTPLALPCKRKKVLTNDARTFAVTLIFNSHALS